MRFDCTFLEASGVAALQEHLFAPVATPISALQVATLGSDLATPRTCTSAKAGCAERQYTVEQLRLAAHSILSAAKSGKPLAAATAARQQGAASMRCGGFATHVRRVRELTQWRQSVLICAPISHAQRAHRPVRPRPLRR